MNEHAEKIQIVIDTLQDLDIKSTFDNMNRLMGALTMLAKIRDELNGPGEQVVELIGGDEKIAEVKEDGNTDVE